MDGAAVYERGCFQGYTWLTVWVVLGKWPLKLAGKLKCRISASTYSSLILNIILTLPLRSCLFRMISELDGDMTDAIDSLGSVTKKVNELVAKTGGCKWLMVVVFLLVVLLVLTFLVVYT